MRYLKTFEQHIVAKGIQLEHDKIQREKDDDEFIALEEELEEEKIEKEQEEEEKHQADVLKKLKHKNDEKK